MTTMSMSVVVLLSRIFRDSFDSPLAAAEAAAAAAFCRQLSSLSRFLSASRMARNSRKFWRQMDRVEDVMIFKNAFAQKMEKKWRFDSKYC
jgi:hypothetical protein